MMFGRRPSPFLLLMIAVMIIIFMYWMFQPSQPNSVTQINMDNAVKNFQEALGKHEQGNVLMKDKKDESDVLGKDKQAESDDLKLKKIIEKIKNLGKPLLVTVINDAYLPFAHSWLCNTIYMNIHEQVLIIVTDTKSHDEIALKWPGINVIAYGGKDDLRGDQDYSHAGYVRIMVRRTEILLEILKQKVDVFIFELDAYWLTNPIPDLQKRIKGYDVIILPVAERKNVVSGGWLYMRPTTNMIKLWEKLTERMKNLEQKIKSLGDKKSVSEADNDQIYISDLITKRYSGVLVTELSLKEFPDGKWYSMKESVRAKLHPVVIQNNWVIGNKAKIKRAKEFRHWFWDDVKRQCDTDLVKQKTAS